MTNDLKTCGGCSETKPVTEFYHRSGGRGVRSACKACWKAVRERSDGTAWRHKYPERAAASKRRTRLKSEYGISPEDWDRMFERQGRACAACGSTHPRDAQGRWATDHDHATGLVRGILCTSCNVALGHLGDDPNRIRALLAYLGDRSA